MLNKILREKDGKRLHQAFYQAFDASAAEQALLYIGEQESLGRRSPLGLDELGEGTHFRAYKLRSPLGDKGVSVCLKIAKPGFVASKGQAGMERWADEVEGLEVKASKNLIPLIPPMTVLRVRARGSLKQDVWGIAMPFGPSDLKAASAHWQPLDALLKELTRGLKEAGYHLDDILQGRCWEGIPFLVDFSDLQARLQRPL